MVTGHEAENGPEVTGPVAGSGPALGSGPVATGPVVTGPVAATGPALGSGPGASARGPRVGHRHLVCVEGERPRTMAVDE